MHGDRAQIGQEIMKIEELSIVVQDQVFDALKNEIKHLCAKSTNSLLRQSNKDDLLLFSFKDIAQEWRENAPLFYRFIACSSTNPTAELRNVLKKGDKLVQTQVAAGCKLLNLYNRDMKSLQLINDVLFLKGGMKKSGFTRLQSTNDCHSYLTTLLLADRFANEWDEQLIGWKEFVETDSELEDQLIKQISYIQDTIDLCGGAVKVDLVNDLVLEKSTLEKNLRDHRSSMHPGYYFIGDNVDMVTKVRHMTSTSQHKDQHMYQMCAYENRVSGNELDNTKPLQDPKTAPFSQLIPGEREKQNMIDNFAYLVAKKWCQYLTFFAPYDAVLPENIDHPFIRETKKCTRRVSSHKFVTFT